MDIKSKLIRYHEGVIDEDGVIEDVIEEDSGEGTPGLSVDPVAPVDPVDPPVRNPQPHTPTLCPWKEALDIKGGGCTIFAGMTLSGKTNTVRNIIKEDVKKKNRKWNQILVMSPNAEFSLDYKFLPRNKKLIPTKARIKKILDHYEGV